MKTITILILAFFLSSCAKPFIAHDYIQFYKQTAAGDQKPCYLTLITDYSVQTYDHYFGGSGYGIAGDFKRQGDTIYLTPKFRYDSLMTVIGSDISFGTIPRVLMLKKNRLIDLTDYSKYPELIPKIYHKTLKKDFIRVKFRKKYRYKNGKMVLVASNAANTLTDAPQTPRPIS